MISLEGVAARRAPLALGSVSLTLGAGVHAVVGGPADGGSLLLAIIAGWERTRAGRVRVLGLEPTHPEVRPQIACVPLRPFLPARMRVAEAMKLAASLRGDPPGDAAERLAVLGVETLAERRVETLSRNEARAVVVAEAATSSRVRVLLVEEPFVGMDPRAVTRLSRVLRERAEGGVALVVATASVREASEIADDHLWLERGAIVGRTASSDGLARFSGSGVRIRVVTPQARALCAALARQECVEAVARRETSVTARGADAVELARALARAIAESGAEVVEMRVQPPSLDEARAGLAGGAEDRSL